MYSSSADVARCMHRVNAVYTRVDASTTGRVTAVKKLLPLILGVSSLAVSIRARDRHHDTDMYPSYHIPAARLSPLSPPPPKNFGGSRCVVSCQAGADQRTLPLRISLWTGPTSVRCKTLR